MIHKCANGSDSASMQKASMMKWKFTNAKYVLHTKSNIELTTGYKELRWS